MTPANLTILGAEAGDWLADASSQQYDSLSRASVGLQRPRLRTRAQERHLAMRMPFSASWRPLPRAVGANTRPAPGSARPPVSR